MAMVIRGTTDYNVYVEGVISMIMASLDIKKNPYGLIKLGQVLSEKVEGNIIYELCKAFDLEYAYYACWGTLVNGKAVYEKLDEIGTAHLRNILKLRSASKEIKRAIKIILEDRQDDTYSEVMSYQELELMNLEDKVFALESTLDNLNRLQDEAIEIIRNNNNNNNNNKMDYSDNNKVSEGFKEEFRKNTTFLRENTMQDKVKTIQEFEEYINSQKSRASLL